MIEFMTSQMKNMLSPHTKSVIVCVCVSIRHVRRPTILWAGWWRRWWLSTGWRMLVWDLTAGCSDRPFRRSRHTLHISTTLWGRFNLWCLTLCSAVYCSACRGPTGWCWCILDSVFFSILVETLEKVTRVLQRAVVFFFLSFYLERSVREKY